MPVWLQHQRFKLVVINELKLSLEKHQAAFDAILGGPSYSIAIMRRLENAR